MTNSVERAKRPRTAAATEAVRRRAARRLSVDLMARLDMLGDDELVTLACVTREWALHRGLHEQLQERWRFIYGERDSFDGDGESD